MVQPVEKAWMAAALAVSWGSMLVHNLYELPLGPLDLENAGPLAVAAGLGLAYAARPCSWSIGVAALGWGALNLGVGGVLTVLPLPILPFAPEQSVSHYAAHAVYTIGQAPLVVLAYGAARASIARQAAVARDG